MTQALGELGPGESEPSIVSWQWYYSLPNVAISLAAVLVLVVPHLIGKGQQDWPLIMAIVLSFILFQMEGASLLVAAPIAALVVVWLIRRRRAR